MVEQSGWMPEEARHKLLLNAAGQSFYNTPKMNLSWPGETNTYENLNAYVRTFSKAPDARPSMASVPSA